MLDQPPPEERPNALPAIVFCTLVGFIVGIILGGILF